MKKKNTLIVLLAFFVPLGGVIAVIILLYKKKKKNSIIVGETQTISGTEYRQNTVNAEKGLPAINISDAVHSIADLFKKKPVATIAAPEQQFTINQMLHGSGPQTSGVDFSKLNNTSPGYTPKKQSFVGGLLAKIF